jgi:hypothetical protein
MGHVFQKPSGCSADLTLNYGTCRWDLRWNMEKGFKTSGNPIAYCTTLRWG